MENSDVSPTESEAYPDRKPASGRACSTSGAPRIRAIRASRRESVHCPQARFAPRLTPIGVGMAANQRRPGASGIDTEIRIAADSLSGLPPRLSERALRGGRLASGVAKARYPRCLQSRIGALRDVQMVLLPPDFAMFTASSSGAIQGPNGLVQHSWRQPAGPVEGASARRNPWLPARIPFGNSCWIAVIFRASAAIRL